MSIYYIEVQLQVKNTTPPLAPPRAEFAKKRVLLVANTLDESCGVQRLLFAIDDKTELHQIHAVMNEIEASGYCIHRYVWLPENKRPLVMFDPCWLAGTYAREHIARLISAEPSELDLNEELFDLNLERCQEGRALRVALELVPAFRLVLDEAILELPIEE